MNGSRRCGRCDYKFMYIRLQEYKITTQLKKGLKLNTFSPVPHSTQCCFYIGTFPIKNISMCTSPNLFYPRRQLAARRRGVVGRPSRGPCGKDLSRGLPGIWTSILSPGLCASSSLNTSQCPRLPFYGASHTGWGPTHDCILLWLPL